MAQNPKYDNDMVNLGYLNKRLGQTEESINKNNSSISRIPKNYSTPPNPPYYKDSLLCYGNKIYRCNKTKMNGNFSWNDWTVVATDDTTISDFINNTYEVEKLEIQEQIDGKIQTHYQENDPSKDWTTDLEKGRHAGDYWYNTSDNTQWRYNQITTGPTITYGWGQVNIPKSVFDTIDRKKSIYTAKPTSYKKDDLWIIEETLSDDDLPIGTDENPIAKGDWVFSIADSENYNKEHWVKRDEDVSLSYLEQHYYTITEIDSNLEVIERNTESKITKATEEISLNVSQTYTTKEEHTKAINDFDKQVGTINQTIIEQKETLSDLSVEVGEVSASVESVETRTEDLTVDLNGVKQNIIPMSTSANSSIYIEDASDSPLIELKIEGKSTQETRSGKNLANFNDSTINLDNYWNFKVGNVEANKNYSLYVYVDGYVSFNLKYGNDEIIQTVYDLTERTIINFSSMQNSYIFINCFASLNDSYKSMPEIMLVEGTYTMENIGNYERYGVSPSPDYPSEIKGVGTYNNETGKYEIEVKTTNGTDTNTSVIVLNEPLRSLPNGVKDIAYIKNNILYVDRYVGNLVLNGDENFEEWYCLNPNNTYGFKLMSIDNIKVLNDSTVYVKMLMSNHFKQLGHQDYLYVNDVENISSTVGNLYFRIARNKATSISEVKAWFRSNNTQVDYELAEPYTEEYGEIDMPSTFKGVNNITTTDELLPIINLTYVRDTILADYVENHIAELKITEGEIKESVEKVSTSVDGLNSTVNRVEEITNDNSQVINIISTNIDKTSGEVREVTTTTGFTFNADGMTIDDGSGFRAEHTAKGTYYKDGNSIVGQYTKDGSKQKDLELFGTYSYGKKSIDDTPMFVGQLYNDENGEECFGHFYNGGDY